MIINYNVNDRLWLVVFFTCHLHILSNLYVQSIGLITLIKEKLVTKGSETEKQIESGMTKHSIDK